MNRVVDNDQRNGRNATTTTSEIPALYTHSQSKVTGYQSATNPLSASSSYPPLTMIFMG